jgi:predicted permease
VRVVGAFVAALARLFLITIPTGEHPMRNVTQDVRYALRRLWHTPGFTAVAIVTLAFGIGANTAIFSLVNGMLLTPLPGADTSRVVGIARHHPDDRNTRLSRDDVDDLRLEAGDVFRHLAVTSAQRGVVSSSTRTEYVIGEVTSHDYFAALGVHPVAGRLFAADDDRSGVPVAVISERLHRQLFSGDPDVIGQSIRAFGISATVVGIVPDSFHGTYLPTLLQSDVWLPLSAAPAAATPGARRVPGLLVLATLHPGETVSRAQSVLGRAADRMAVRPEMVGVRLGTASPQVVVMPNQFETVGVAIGTAIVGLAALVLLIACSNLANLFLARGAGRSTELAVRLALGASRLRLLRLLAFEVVVVVALGSCVGWVIAHAASSALSAIPVPALAGMQLSPALGGVADVRVFLFMVLVAVGAAIVAGLIPAWRSSNVHPNGVLATVGGTGGNTPGRTHVGRRLVAVQVGVCVVLLLASALFGRSAVASLTHDLGFHTDRGAQVSVDLDLHGLDEPTGRRYQARALEAVSAMTGVSHAALYDHLPLGPQNNADRVVPASEVVGPDTEGRRSRYSHVTGDFFNIVRWPVLRGRVFTEADGVGAPLVVVVNQGLADRLWPGQDPIGQALAMLDKGVTLTVIGVVADVDTAWPTRDWRDRAPDNYLFVSARQHYRAKLSVLASGATPPAALVGPRCRFRFQVSS